MTLLTSTLLSGGSMIDLDATLVVQMGLFFVALLVLHTLIFKPLLKVFEAREEAIDGAKDAARQFEADAAGAGTEFEEKMRDIRVKAGEERDRLRAEGGKLEAGILASVQSETQKQLTDADAQLTAEAAKLRRELQTQVPALARTIAGKLLQREVQ
ncbi:MAG: H(+)-transporting ATPase [Polyangiales bacterium]